MFTNVLINVSDASGNFDMSIIALPHVWLTFRSDAGADVVHVRPSPTNTYTVHLSSSVAVRSVWKLENLDQPAGYSRACFVFSVFTGVSYFQAWLNIVTAHYAGGRLVLCPNANTQPRSASYVCAGLTNYQKFLLTWEA